MIKNTLWSKTIHVLSTFTISGVLLGSAFTLSCEAMDEDEKFTSHSRQNLPDEILLKLFSFMSPKALGKIGCISQDWRRVSKDASLWKVHGVLSKEDYIKIYLYIQKIVDEKPCIYTHIYAQFGQDVGMKLTMYGRKKLTLSKEQKEFLDPLVFSILSKKYRPEHIGLKEVGEVIQTICKISFETNHRFIPECNWTTLIIIKNLLSPQNEMDEIIRFCALRS